MKKVKLSSLNIIDAMGISNSNLIKGLTIKQTSVPQEAGFILLLALNQATGGLSGIIAFSRAAGHMGNSVRFHVGNYGTTSKTKWSDSSNKFYSVKKGGTEYIAIYKDAANTLVQLLTFYGAPNSTLEYAAESSLTDIVQIQ